MVGIEDQLARVGDELAVHIAGALFQHGPVLHGFRQDRRQLPVVAHVGDLADVVEDQRLLGEMDALLQLASASGGERKAACIEITALCVAVGGPGVVYAVLGVPQIAAVEEARVHGHVRAALIAAAAVEEDVAHRADIREEAGRHLAEGGVCFPVVLGENHIDVGFCSGDHPFEE